MPKASEEQLEYPQRHMTLGRRNPRDAEFHLGLGLRFGQFRDWSLPALGLAQASELACPHLSSVSYRDDPWDLWAQHDVTQVSG